MAHPGIGRFFSFRQTLTALGIAGVGLVVGAIFAYEYLVDHRIYIWLGLVTLGLLVLAPIYFVAEAFPKGCKACKRAFAKKTVSFPAGWREVIQRYLAAPDQATWQQLCYAPVHGQSERALLIIEHCDGCGKIGQAKLVIEEARDGDWSTRDHCEERIMESPMLTWLTQMADTRNGTPQHSQGSR